MSRRPLVAALVATLGLAGCGGGGDGGASRVFARDALKRCLARGSAAVTTRREALDEFAQRAGRGGIEVVWGRGANAAAVAVELSEAAAGATAKRYESVYRALGDAPGDRLLRRGNVVVAYQLSPGKGERRLVEGCLR